MVGGVHTLGRAWPCSALCACRTYVNKSRPRLTRVHVQIFAGFYFCLRGRRRIRNHISPELVSVDLRHDVCDCDAGAAGRQPALLPPPPPNPRHMTSRNVTCACTQVTCASHRRRLQYSLVCHPMRSLRVTRCILQGMHKIT